MKQLTPVGPEPSVKRVSATNRIGAAVGFSTKERDRNLSYRAA